MTPKVIDRAELGGNKTKFYEVFARISSEDALAHIGSIEAPNDELAQARAWYVYDERRWKEMCVVPTDAVISVTGRGARGKIKEI